MAEYTGDTRSPVNFLAYYNPPFDQSYLTHFYTTQLNHTLDRCFDQFESSIDIPLKYTATLKNSTLPTPTSSTEEWASLSVEPIRRINQFEPGASSTTTPHSTLCSPQNSWPTPPVCGDVPTQIVPHEVQYHRSPFHSASYFLDCEFLCCSPVTAKERIPKRAATRKRGRPHMHREGSSSSTLLKYSDRTHKYRIKHNQVERKYREGLNAGIERLHRAVPTLRQRQNDGTLGQARLSKLTVLAGAVEYIKKIEQDRDAAVRRLQYLRGLIY